MRKTIAYQLLEELGRRKMTFTQIQQFVFEMKTTPEKSYCGRSTYVYDSAGRYVDRRYPQLPRGVAPPGWWCDYLLGGMHSDHRHGLLNNYCAKDKDGKWFRVEELPADGKIDLDTDTFAWKVNEKRKEKAFRKLAAKRGW